MAAQVEEQAKTWYQKTEGRLYAYPALLVRHKAIIEEIKQFSPITAVAYKENTAKSNLPSSDVEKWVLRQERLNQSLLFIEDKLQTELFKISSLWQLLTEDEKQLIELQYFEQKTRSFIMDEMQRSHPTYKKIRDKAVLKAAYIFENIDYETYTMLLIS